MDYTGFRSNMLSSAAAWSSSRPAFPFLCLFDISLSHRNLCFSKMFHLLTYNNCPVGAWIWSQCGGRAGGETAHAEKGSVSEGGKVQRLTRYMGSKLVSGGNSEGCEWGHYGFSLNVETELPPSCHDFGSAQWEASSHFLGYIGQTDEGKIHIKRRCISKHFSLFRCNCFSLKTSSFWVVDELLWSTISTSLSNGPAFNSSCCFDFIVGGSYYKRP